MSEGKKSIFIIILRQPGRCEHLYRRGTHPAAIDAGNKNYSYIYVLEDRNGYLRALPAKDENTLMDVLMQFFPARFVERYAEENGPIKYKHIPKMVKLYNSR